MTGAISMAADTAPSLRARRRHATLQEIKDVARSLLVEEGAAAVTLRGIAGRMGVSAPALYRYFDSREALHLALVADLYDQLTAALVQVRDSMATAPTGDRLVAVCRAFRGWATAHPAEFGLVFANPVNGTTGNDAGIGPVEAAGQRLGGVFVSLFVELWTERGFPAPTEEELDPRLRTKPGPVADVLPPGARYVFLRCWARLYGAVAMEVFGQLAWALDDLDPVFDDLMVELADALGLPRPDHPSAGGI
jgi:AcrR family transcriptional regulator